MEKSQGRWKNYALTGGATVGSANWP